MSKTKNFYPVMTFLHCFESNSVFAPSEIDAVLEIVTNQIEIVAKKKTEYIQIPCAFDIESTSFYEKTHKRAIMYEWTFGIGGLVIIGRTWPEFVSMINRISDLMQINVNRRLMCYVHNLSFEFQFMRKWFEWETVFATDSRKPIYAVTKNGIEFRCSYILSGYSLSKLAENLQTFRIKKLTGELDYDLIRHSTTPLTDEEIGYCINDVKIVMAYESEEIAKNGNVTLIPYTKTGYVRRYCRDNCFDSEFSNHFDYYDTMQRNQLMLTEYKQLKRAFQGGFTHASPFFTGRTVDDVTSYDLTSSYPTVMVSEKYPMSSAEEIKIETYVELEKNIDYYCCLFDVEIKKLESTIFFDNYISISRCWEVEKPIVSNGRIVSADLIHTTVTDVDYKIIRKYYHWESIKIYNFRRYKKDYLPSALVDSILTLYENKTKLKGVTGEEVEYLSSKEMVNSVYGMMVTAIIRDEHKYEKDIWKDEPGEEQRQIDTYNKNWNRFLCYPWGVWVTAYARRNLFTAISEFSDDYIYSDTDSVKVRNIDNHMEYINKYNEMIKKRLLCAMDYHGFRHERISPKTVKGVEKTLGLWDFDGHYSKFKTLGAKRYMVQYADDPRNGDDCGKYSITVSGLNKKLVIPWMRKTYSDIFTAFRSDLLVPSGYTGKNTHTYIDDNQEGIVTDYMGTTAEYHEKSSVHMESVEYSLSISHEYYNYFMSVQEEIS